MEVEDEEKQLEEAREVFYSRRSAPKVAASRTSCRSEVTVHGSGRRSQVTYMELEKNGLEKNGQKIGNKYRLSSREKRCYKMKKGITSSELKNQNVHGWSHL